MESRQEFLNKPSRNSIMFKEFVESKGYTLLTVKMLLNKYGIDKFNKYISDDGEWVLPEEKKLGSRGYHSADNGLRSPAELEIDCIAGNIQECLFCIKSGDIFKINDDATNLDNNNDGNITKNPDLKYGNQLVEFKTVACKKEYVNYQCKYFNNGEIYKVLLYDHRDGNIKKSLEDGKSYILYFYNLNKLVLLNKNNFDEIANVYGEEIKYNKKYDKVAINAYNNYIIPFDMFDSKKYSNELTELMNSVKGEE